MLGMILRHRKVNSIRGLSICPSIHVSLAKGNGEEMNTRVHKRKWGKGHFKTRDLLGRRMATEINRGS